MKSSASLLFEKSSQNEKGGGRGKEEEEWETDEVSVIFSGKGVED